MPDFQQFLSRIDELELASQLATVAVKRRLGNVSIGVVGHDQVLFAAVCEHGDGIDGRTAADTPVRAGCLAKPVTATLITQLVAAKKLSWRDDVAELLEANGTAGTRLTGVTVLHLLNHTHGLDASCVDRVSRTPDGWIEIDSLCEKISARPLAAPGELYSYSNLGAWLAGALLEKIYCRPYVELLRERYLLPRPDYGMTGALEQVCPATGGDLRLTLRQWLQFIQRHAFEPPEDFETAEGLQARLPGWSPFEQGVCRGWKMYGGGWLGHNSNPKGCSAVLRFNSRDRAAVIICAEAEGAAVLALAEILGPVLPEFENFSTPRLLRGPLNAETSCFTGSYSRSGQRLVVTATDKGQLFFEAQDLHSGRESAAHQLLPAQNELFILEPCDDRQFRLVQFLRRNLAGEFEYVWNGRELWRRE